MFLEKPGSTVRDHFTPTRMAIIQKTDMEKLEPSRGAEEYKTAQPPWETWRFLTKSDVELPYDPGIPRLSTQPKGPKAGPQISIQPC